MTYINSLCLIPNIKQIDPYSPSMKCSLYMNTNNTANHRNCIPLPCTFAGSVDGNCHAFPWLGEYYLIFESIWAWHIPLIYYIWTITRSRLISWLRGKVKADIGWWSKLSMTHPLTSIYGNKWALGRSRLITWLPCLSALYPQSGLKFWSRSIQNLC